MSTVVKRGLVVIAVAAAAATALGGCSSSGKPSGASTSGGPSGSSIKIGMIADVGTAVDFGDDEAAAKAAILGINSRGGVDGHPLVLDFCNGGLDPNKDAACVRKVIADHPIAMAGVEDVSYEENADKLFSSAGIANVSPVAYSYDFQDPNSYLTSPGEAFLNAGQDVEGAKYGGKRSVLVRVDIPTTIPYLAAHQKLVPMLGGVLAGQATVPETPGDDSAVSAKLEGYKPEWVDTDANEADDVSILKDMTQLGFTGKEAVAGDALQYSTIKGLGALASRLLFTNAFPPVSASATVPGLVTYKQDMAAYYAATKDHYAANYANYNRDVALEGYLGVTAIAKIASQAHSTTASTFQTAIKAAKGVDLGGIIPAWTPSKSISTKFPRASTALMYFSHYTNGKLTLLQSAPVDVAKYVDATN